MDRLQHNNVSVGSGFHPIVLLLVVLVLLILIFSASRWYAARVSLPRYCAQPELSLQRLAAIMSQERPAGDQSRRDYVIAAKLKFLLPAVSGETDREYLQRLSVVLEEQCS